MQGVWMARSSWGLSRKQLSPGRRQNWLEEPWIGPYIASMTAIATMPEGVRERWRTAGRFADVLEAEVKTRRNPFAARVVSWFNLCRVCQDLEEQMLLVVEELEEAK
jgi:hypothetical protein